MSMETMTTPPEETQANIETPITDDSTVSNQTQKFEEDLSEMKVPDLNSIAQSLYEKNFDDCDSTETDAVTEEFNRQSNKLVGDDDSKVKTSSW